MGTSAETQTADIRNTPICPFYHGEIGAFQFITLPDFQMDFTLTRFVS
jgi:hypothetical protein